LNWDDLSFLVEVAVERLGVRALRLTGGEPTLRPGLVGWIASLRARATLYDVAMTTNGMMLADMAESLAAAGLDRVNVSLDSLDPERFALITRGGSFARAMHGIEVARQHFASVRINVVLLNGVNVEEIEDFVDLSDKLGLEVRFIEPMPLGDDKQWWQRHFIAVEEVIARLAAAGHLLTPDDRPGGHGPAITYRVEGTRARIGFISQMSCTKCATCNKLRVTSDGCLRPCLLSAQEIDLRPAIRERDVATLEREIAGQFLSRRERYDLTEATTQSLGRTMKAIGG